jgi:hypothetical protein
VRSLSSGAKLTRTSVFAKRLAIVATTCSTCGKVRVYWGSTLLKTVSLYSATTKNKQVISVTTFSSPRSGTLSLKVYGSGKKVTIDGVAIGRN